MSKRPARHNGGSDGSDAVLDFLRKSPKVPSEKLTAIANREEVLFVSLLLKDLDFMTDAVESGFSPLCFQNEVPRRIFTVAAEHFDRFGTRLTRQSMESILASTSTPEEAAFLLSQYDAIFAEYIRPNSGEYKMFKDAIECRFVQRQAYHACQTYAAKLLTSTSDQKALVAELQNMVGEITTFNELAAFAQTTTLADEAVALKQEIIDRRDNPEKFVGIRCGYKEVDDDYNGFVKQRYMVITATEGGGKSTLMMNLARNFAVAGNNVVYVTIESINRDIARRMLTIHSSVSYNRIMRGGTDMESGLCPHIVDELNAAADDLINGAGKRFHLIQVLEHTPLDVIFRRINRRRAYAPIDVVFVDYLQVIGREKDFGERVDQSIAYVSSKLRAWGRANNVLVITANQLKSAKGGKLQEAKTDDDPDLVITKADTSGSKEIAGAADYMFGVFVPRMKDRLVLYSTKTRMGRDTQKYVFTYDCESGRVESSAMLGDIDKMAEELRDEGHRKAIKSGKSVEQEGGQAPKPGQAEMTIEDAQNIHNSGLPLVASEDEDGGFASEASSEEEVP